MAKVVAIVLMACLLLILGPLLTIWSLNTLFPVLEIPYALDTWAAIVLLGFCIRAKVEK